MKVKMSSSAATHALKQLIAKDKEIATLKAEIVNREGEKQEMREVIDMYREALELMLKSPAERLEFCNKHGLIDKTKNGLFEDWTTDDHWRKQIVRKALLSGNGQQDGEDGEKK